MVEIQSDGPRILGHGSGYIYFIVFFLQIYKLSGSYIKECKNHFQKFEKFFRNSGFLGVSCMICSGLNRFK